MTPPPALALPAIHASHGGCWVREARAPLPMSTRQVGKGDAIMAASDTPLLMLNAPLVASRLGYPDLSGLDLLELFAFIHPAKFAVPTVPGQGTVPVPGTARGTERARKRIDRCRARHGRWQEWPSGGYGARS